MPDSRPTFQESTNRLNNLNTRLHTQHGQIVALENQVAALQDQVSGLSNQVAGLQNQVTSMSNQLNCYGTVKVAQYPHSAATSNGDLTPYAGGTWLDLMHPDSPAKNQVYPLVVGWCVQ